MSTTLSLIRKAMFIDQRFLKRVWKLSTGERSISTVPGADIANLNQEDDDKKSDGATEIVTLLSGTMKSPRSFLMATSDRYNSKHLFLICFTIQYVICNNADMLHCILQLGCTYNCSSEHCKQTQAFCSQSHNPQSNFKVLSTMNSLRVVRKVTSVAQRRNMSDIFETKNKIASVRKTFYSNPEAGKFLPVHILIFYRT